MSRWLWFFVCAVLGLLLLACGWLLPVHLRAVDVLVLQRAGRRTPTVVDAGLALLRDQKVGAAELFYEAALSNRVARADSLGAAITNTLSLHPAWSVWGGGEPHLEILFSSSKTSGTPSLPLTDWILRLENRGTGLEVLRTSSKQFVRELMRCRGLTNTVVFDPATSSSGQAFDAALSICGMLAEEGHLNLKLAEAIYPLALDANQGSGSGPLESVCMDFLSLGQRLNWGQMAALADKIDDTSLLHEIVDAVRQNDANLPVIYTATLMAAAPKQLSSYILRYGNTGIADVSAALVHGSGGLNQLLASGKRYFNSDRYGNLREIEIVRDYQSFVVENCWRQPSLMLAVKWTSFFLAGLLLAAAMHHLWPPPTRMEEPLQVRGFHVAREFLFALGLLLVILLLTEPFLAQTNQQRVQMPFRLRLPIAGAAAGGIAPVGKANFMNESNLLTMLLFFVLQGLLYVACVVKLAEIRRQRVAARMKLRLLENEEHLFDAGLYLGFVGTIISLILSTLKSGHQFSLMAAYSSTSFGIIFVSLFKIFHLRPAKRKLLLEADEAEHVAPVAEKTVVVAS